MKIVVDMNLSPDWVVLLCAAGMTAVHWSTIGDARAPDSEILNWAAQNGYIVFTNDMDFGALLAYSKAVLPSVFQLRTANVSPKKAGTRVIGLLQRFGVELDRGALVSVSDANERVRILPFN